MTIQSTLAVGLHAFDAEITDLQNAVLGLLGAFTNSILSIANGGTNSGTALSGSSIMVSNGTQIVQGAAGTTTTLLHGNPTGAPTYGAVALGADVSGTLPEGSGGTNQSTYAQGDLLYASAVNTLAKLGKGTSGQLLQIGATIPVWAGETAWTAVLGGVGFANSWVDYPGYPAAFLKDPAGRIHLRGAISSGVVSSPAFTLPVGYRPTNTRYFPVVSNSAAFAFGTVLVKSDGTVNPWTPSVNSFVALDGISFDALS